MVVLQAKHCASIGNPQRNAATLRTNRGATPRAPLDASGGCLEMEISASGPRGKCGYISDLLRRRTPMRVKMGAGQMGGGRYPWGLVILVTNQGAPTRAGGEANYFKPARGGPVLLVECFRGGAAFPRVFV